MKKEKLVLNGLANSIRKSYLKTRAKARWVGFFYFLATVALAVMGCMPMVAPMFDNRVVDLSVTSFAGHLKGLLRGAWNGQTVMAAFYVVMLIVLVFNVCRALVGLGKLFTNKIDKEDLETINGNVLSMQNMGKIFSCSSAAIFMFFRYDKFFNRIIIIIYSFNYSITWCKLLNSISYCNIIGIINNKISVI